ncbi:MAG TPA: hypothetical protein VJI52_06410 [Candidatus Nanoarchaeia archaeon]|nr:hypothetical protein [Candidatus Nanoarchaeia archaeon]
MKITMPLYLLDSCPPDKLGSIEELCKDAGVGNLVSGPRYRDRDVIFDKFLCVLSYDPGRHAYFQISEGCETLKQFPLAVEIRDERDILNPTIISFLRRLVMLLEPAQIYECRENAVKLDICPSGEPTS